jgi:hypothetical protein
MTISDMRTGCGEDNRDQSTEPEQNHFNYPVRDESFSHAERLDGARKFAVLGALAVRIIHDFAQSPVHHIARRKC